MRPWALALALAVLLALPRGAVAAPLGQGVADAPGSVIALAWTPHVWIVGADGLLHWEGDARALAGAAAPIRSGG